MNLSVDERLQFQYLLPAQGDFKTLELVESIFNKLHIKDMTEEEKDFVFKKEEISLLKESIRVLDRNHKLPLQALSVIRKIMEEPL